MKRSRTDAIMGDAAYIILSSDSRKNTGNYYIVNNLLFRMMKSSEKVE